MKKSIVGLYIMTLCNLTLFAQTEEKLTQPTYDFQVLHTFCSSGGSKCTDGAGPVAGLIEDAAGNLYGTTQGGGNVYGGGTVFKLDVTGKETVLHRFCGTSECKDGKFPSAGLIEDSAGNLYGTTQSGGADPGGGTVFKVDVAGREHALLSFCSSCADGWGPNAGLIQDADGNLYGTALSGGTHGGGTVFKLDKTNHSVALYNFCSASNCVDGSGPYAGLIADAAGNLYGTTVHGGANGGGVVFRLTPSGMEKVLYSFCLAPNCTDGQGPAAALIRDAAGYLYGTTASGGANGSGAVFRVTTAGREKVLYSFCSAPNCTDGSYPQAGLVRDSAGNLYGTTAVNGANGGGTVFKLSRNLHYDVLYNFCSAANCADGSHPFAGVSLDAAGNLFGTTNQGGKYGYGTLFKLGLISGSNPH
ncbi:MAG TPA: choice-of-anchor tandem repeat GloVer-containing protein [Candidatus Sulfotelmatobacter sp.]|nr:choice-of-anchor tandem repeat GloVer-containing protein [Candidatus Sulfotelmatobacter sp.]